MNKKKQRSFNLIEVTLALGVAVIGVVCVMALLPVGLNASRDAVADNYLPDIAEEILSAIQMSYLKETSWPNPDTTNWKDYDNALEFPGAEIPSGRTKDFFGRSLDRAGGLVVALDKDEAKDGIFLVLQQSRVDDMNVTDFSAVARVRTDKLVNNKLDNDKLDDWEGVSLAVPDELARAIFVEMSWPANMPYSRRKELGNIRMYRLDLFKPEEL